MKARHARQIRYGILSARIDHGVRLGADHFDFLVEHGCDQEYLMETRLEHRAYDQTSRNIAQRTDCAMREFMDWVHGVNKESPS